MSFIQTAQNVYVSNATFNNVAGNQYSIIRVRPVMPIDHPAAAHRLQQTTPRVAAKGSEDPCTPSKRSLTGQPPHALFAAFDSNRDRTRCLVGTRTDILNQVFRWIGMKSDEGSGAPRDPQDKACVFWINGSAGTGKTTISYTVAEECRKYGILGASFFCSRDDPACSDPGLIFTTIAYQLGIFSPPFQAEVSRVMVSQPAIGYASISYQIEQLIVNPLRSLAGSIRPSVVVVDALDECRDNGTPSIILSSLARYVTDLYPLKFLVTSRPENHITMAFRDKDLRATARQLILHEVLLDVVQDDITSYLSSKLASTRDAYNIQSEWPSTEDVRELARLSHGLFIFAATSVKFIEDRNYSHPRRQLAYLLSAPPETDDRSPHVHLYRLYTQVLEHAFPDPSPDLSERLRKILGSIVLIREPLSSFALEHLIGLEPSTVREALVHVHSIIIVPEKDTETIRLLHPSFFDFITNPERCQNSKFVVDTKTQHTFLARACFQAMKRLRRDICGITNPSTLNGEVGDLSTRIETSIPPHVQYACRHWGAHLAQSAFSDDVVNLVEEFCTKKLLNWLEVCSLLGELRSALLSLNATQQAILVRHHLIQSIVPC
jgi:hypothetical protein